MVQELGLGMASELLRVLRKVSDDRLRWPEGIADRLVRVRGLEVRAVELVGGQNVEAEPQTGTGSFRSVTGPIWAHEEDTWLDFAKWEDLDALCVRRGIEAVVERQSEKAILIQFLGGYVRDEFYYYYYYLFC